ncbi:MAG: tyrosine-type recombinase/integrase [Planctomycetota bacterium]
MPKSNPKRPKEKPRKPRRDFPLFAHINGQWAKKIKGKLHYFGLWAEPAAALARYLDTREDLHAGRTPRAARDGLTVADLANHFLNHKKMLVDSGELAPRTFQRYYVSCKTLADTFGRKRLVDDLVADDFQLLRQAMAKRWGPVAVGNEIQMVRSVFRYGYEAGLIDKAIRFGPGFKKPSAKTIRQTRARGGVRMWEPGDVLKALEHAGPNMRAMILLGLNGGLGNTDVALLPIKAANLKTRWLDYPRAKTAIDRRIPLWPETAAAMRAALASRPEPKDPADADLLFIGPRRASYVGSHKGHRVDQELKRVLRAAGIEGRTFYDLRRTFQTIAEGAHDLVAVQSIMGHASATGDMSAVYRQRVDDDRLVVAGEPVRGGLYADVVDAQAEQPDVVRFVPKTG